MPESPSEDNKPRAELNPVVFFGSAALILLLVIFSASVPKTAGLMFASLQSWIVNTFGWFYLLSVATFLLFSAALAISSYGAIRLGHAHL